MARVARVMFAGCPFHLTHRGNLKKTVFHSDRDRAHYLALLRRYAVQFEMKIWAYCLMDNHVHLIVIGAQKSSIPKAIGNAHRVYSRRKNLGASVTGHLWANRFFSTALDEPHLWAAVRYVELNPARAGVVKRATGYRWSSARAHVGLRTEVILDPERPFPGPIQDWSAWLSLGLEEGSERSIRRNTNSGLPSGSERFIVEVENRLGRPIRLKRSRAKGH